MGMIKSGKDPIWMMTILKAWWLPEPNHFFNGGFTGTSLPMEL